MSETSAWRAFAAAASFAAVSGADTVEAQNPSCASLGSEAAPIICGRGGSAGSVLIGRFAVAIKESSEPLTVVYKDDGACFAMESLINGQKLTSDAKYWIRDGEGKIVASPKGKLVNVKKPEAKAAKKLLPLRGLKELKPLKPLWGIGSSDLPAEAFFLQGRK